MEATWKTTVEFKIDLALVTLQQIWTMQIQWCAGFLARFFPSNNPQTDLFVVSGVGCITTDLIHELERVSPNLNSEYQHFIVY